MAKHAKKEKVAKGKKAVAKEKGKKNNAKKGAKYILKHLYFGKNLLDPYINEDGCPFYLNKGKDEMSQLKLKNIVKGRNADNEELCRRPGMGLALDAASLNHGAKALVKHCSGQWPPEVKADMDKTGMLQVCALFEGDDGKVLLEALDTLDVGRSRQPKKKPVRKAVQALVRFLTNDVADKQKQFARMMTFAARQYLFASTALKGLALGNHLPDWAAKFQGQQSKEIEGWRKKPSDTARLVEALTAELLAKIENDEPSGRRRTVSESSEGQQASESEEKEAEDDSASEEAGADGSDSDSGSDAAPPASSTESSDSTAKKKVKHAKKAKEKHPKKDKKDSKKDKKEPKKSKEADAAEAKTAAFTAWRQGDVQCLTVDATNFKQEIGNLPGGTVKTEEVMALVSRVPDQVQEHYPSFRATVDEVKKQEADVISNSLGKKLVAKLAALASEAEAWWEEQTGGATAAAST